MFSPSFLVVCGVLAWDGLPWPELAWPPLPGRVAEVQVTAEVRTPAEKAADEAYLKENHWRLSPGSCQMLGCAVHPGKWELVPGPAPVVKEPTGHWEQRRLGLFRTQSVWVADDYTQLHTDKPTGVSGSDTAPASGASERTKGTRPAPTDRTSPDAGCNTGRH